MRVAELSRRSGVPVPTIKFYLREGLLQPGEFSSPNQARYDDEHLRRLRLVRSLVEIGRLPIAKIRELLDELDGPEPDLHHVLGHALRPTAAREAPAEDQVAEAQEQVTALIERRGWRISGKAPARRALAEVIVALTELDVPEPIDMIDSFADAAERIAEADMELIYRRRDDPASLVYGAVIGTIIGDSLIVALRRLAQEHTSAKLLGVEDKHDDDHDHDC
jgi:DNA-binding transcriptional MerR regulator